MQLFVHGAEWAARHLRDVLQTQVSAVAQREHLLRTGLEALERSDELFPLAEVSERVAPGSTIARGLDVIERTALRVPAPLVIGDEIQCNGVDPRLLAALAPIEAPVGANDTFERVGHDLLSDRWIPRAVRRVGVYALGVVGEESLDVVVAHAVR